MCKMLIKLVFQTNLFFSNSRKHPGTACLTTKPSFGSWKRSVASCSSWRRKNKAAASTLKISRKCKTWKRQRLNLQRKFQGPKHQLLKRLTSKFGQRWREWVRSRRWKSGAKISSCRPKKPKRRRLQLSPVICQAVTEAVRRGKNS